MADFIDDIDSLHAKLRAAELRLLQCDEKDPAIEAIAREVAGRRNTLSRRVEADWSAISARMRQAEEEARKWKYIQHLVMYGPVAVSKIKSEDEETTK